MVPHGVSGARTGRERVVESEAWTGQKLSKSVGRRSELLLNALHFSWMARRGIYNDVALNRGSRVLTEVELICGRNVSIDNEGDRRRALSGGHSRPASAFGEQRDRKSVG